MLFSNNKLIVNALLVIAKEAAAADEMFSNTYAVFDLKNLFNEVGNKKWDWEIQIQYIPLTLQL